MSIRTELELLSSAKLIEALSIRIYEPPLSTARDRLREVNESLRIPILILDFDTELNMSGMLGFLENSTGLYFAETIEAFNRIGASETATILRAIGKTLEMHGVTPAGLRADFAGTQEYQITTFQDLHGDLGTMPSEVEEDAKRLLYTQSPVLASQFGPCLKRLSNRIGPRCLPRLDVWRASSSEPVAA